jgi:methyl-accepting chemotaxis protein
METGQRGFMVTGEDEYLEPYEGGKNRFRTLIKNSQELTNDNLNQVKRWQEVEALQAELIKTVAEPEIKVRRAANLGTEAIANFKQISSRTVGKDIFESIRVVLAELDSKFKRENKTPAANLITNITLDLVNMETGQRGFLLTGLDISLEPFNAGQISLKNHVESLRTQISGSAVSNSDL